MKVAFFQVGASLPPLTQVVVMGGQFQSHEAKATCVSPRLPAEQTSMG